MQEENSNPSLLLRLLTTFLGFIASFIGAVVTFSLCFHLSIMSRIFPYLFPLETNAAIGIFLGGIGLISIFEQHKRVSWILGTVLVLLSSATLLEYVTGRNLGIDNLLVNTLGRMSPQAGLCFFAFGMGLLIERIIPDEYKIVTLCQSFIGTVLLFMGGVGIFAQLFQIPSAFTWGAYKVINMPTAIGFLVLGLGFILAGFRSIYLSLIITFILGFTLAVQSYQELAKNNQASQGAIIPPLLLLMMLLLTAITLLYIYSQIKRMNLIENEVELRTVEIQESNQKLKEEISIRQAAEKKALEAMRVKSDFTSMVSHELRTPLGIIKESLAIVYDQIIGPINADQKDFLETAKRNIERLERLINEVLDYQKIESGQMEFKMEQEDINKIVKEVTEHFRLSLTKKGLTLDLQLEEGLPPIYFDNDKITQVLINLLNNAMKFSEKGPVTVSTQKLEDNKIRISVADQGIGIKEEDMDKLFKNFSQISTGKGRKTGGTGLGLALSKSIIDHHHGKIGVSSVFGQGSTFYFILPIEN